MRDPFCITVPNLVLVVRRYRDFFDFQDGNRRHLGFSKIQYVAGQFVSPCQMSPKLVKRLLTCDDLMVLFFEMAAVRHLGFVGRLLGPPEKTTWWSSSLCEIWLESL